MFLKKRGNNKKYYKSLFSKREWSFGLCWFFVCLGGCFVFEIVLNGFWKHCCEFKDKLIAKVLSSKNSAGCLLIRQLEKCGLRIYSCLKKYMVMLPCISIMYEKTDLQILQARPGSADSWQGSFAAVSPAGAAGLGHQVNLSRLLHGCVPWAVCMGVHWQLSIGF